MEIVKFKNGKYGIRKRSCWIGPYVYKDLYNDTYWWNKFSKYFVSECQATLEDVERIVEGWKVDEVVRKIKM